MNVFNAHESMQLMYEQEYASALDGLGEAAHELVRRVDDIKNPGGLESDTETLAEKTRQLDRATRAVLARMP